MKTLLNSLYYLLIAALCAVGLLVLASLLPVKGNFFVKVVKSGSMEPNIPVGSVVVDVPSSEYVLGDVITFGVDTKTQIPTTHRIVGISGAGDSEVFTTKGDANNAPDQNTTPIKDVHGKVILVIPYLGYVLVFAKTKLGFISLIGIPAALICIEEIINIFKEVTRLRREKKMAVVAPRKRFDPVQIEPERPRFVTDLRVTTPTTAARARKSRMPSAGQTIVASFGIVFALTLLSTWHGSSDTVAMYQNSLTSVGNKMARGEDPQPLPRGVPLLLFANTAGLVEGTSTAELSDTIDASSTDETSSSTPDTIVEESTTPAEPPALESAPVTDSSTSSDTVSDAPPPPPEPAQTSPEPSPEPIPEMPPPPASTESL